MSSFVHVWHGTWVYAFDYVFWMHWTKKISVIRSLDFRHFMRFLMAYFKVILCFFSWQSHATFGNFRHMIRTLLMTKNIFNPCMYHLPLSESESLYPPSILSSPLSSDDCIPGAQPSRTTAAQVSVERRRVMPPPPPPPSKFYLRFDSAAAKMVNNFLCHEKSLSSRSLWHCRLNNAPASFSSSKHIFYSVLIIWSTEKCMYVKGVEYVHDAC